MSIFRDRMTGATAAAAADNDDDDDDNDVVYFLPVSWWKRLCKFYIMMNSHWCTSQATYTVSHAAMSQICSYNVAS